MRIHTKTLFEPFVLVKQPLHKLHLLNRSRSKEKDNTDIVSEKKKIKEEKEDEKVEDVSCFCLVGFYYRLFFCSCHKCEQHVILCPRSKTLTRTNWRRR